MDLRRLALPPGALTVIAAVLLILPASAAAARTIKVTNQHDSGPGSLRSALGRAHDGDTILVPAGTYRLKSQLFITPSVTVIGAGSKKTILTAGDRTRVIDTTNASATVTLERLAVTHGKAEAGGGILNIAKLRLNHVAVSDNLAAGGESANLGGGIANSGLLEITHSQISDNKTAAGTAQGRGAGIADGNSGGSIAVTASTISGNKTLGGNDAGGAILYEPTVSNGSPEFPLTLDRDMFSENVSNGGSDHALGGALFYGPVSDTTASFPLDLVNDTFVDNRVGNMNADGLGGGLMVEPVIDVGTAEFHFQNLTITRNIAEDDGGGGGIFYDPVGTFSASFVNTIIALNKAANGPDCNENLPSAGHNLESHVKCGFNNAVGDMQNIDPKLGPLASNGGPTKTLALLPGSPAIDAGSDMECPSIDQRGVSRPQGPHCDIGAFERKH